MYNTAAVVTLREDIARGVVPNNEALRAKVDAVVDEMKTAGWPPERVVVAVKQIASDAGLRPTIAVLSRICPLNDSDVAITQIVRWCIERYYLGGDDRSVSALSGERPALR